MSDDAAQDGTSARAGSQYLLMATPRPSQPSVQVAMKFNDRQQIAFERHEWKRCIGVRTMRWVRLPVNSTGLCGQCIAGSDIVIVIYCIRLKSQRMTSARAKSSAAPSFRNATCARAVDAPEPTISTTPATMTHRRPPKANPRPTTTRSIPQTLAASSWSRSTRAGALYGTTESQRP